MASSRSFKHSLKALFIGKRPFPKRLLLALLPSLALSFTLFFFGPLDLSYVSRNFVSYSALEVLPYTAVIFVAVFAILLLVASIPGGIIHAFWVSLYTGLAAGCYLQGAFLNPDLGVLDGHTVNWSSFSTIMMVNLFVWLVILLIPHLVHYFNNKVWRGFVMLLCGALILMQSVSLGVKLIDQAKVDKGKADKYYISSENLLNLGKNKNVIVFLLDGFSNTTFNQVEENYENIMYPLRDFTRFDNASTHYQRTVPSLANLLTGQTWNCSEEGYKDFFYRAWNSDQANEFYSILKQNNYSVDIYALKSEFVSNLSDLDGKANNVLPYEQGKQLVKTAFIDLIKLCFYRYFPIAMKPYFVIYSTDIATMFTTDQKWLNQWELVDRFWNDGLKAEKENAFMFYYLQGTHHPFLLDETGRRVGDYANLTTDISQAAGFIHLITEYIYQMKLLGIYDEAEIIILADHGSAPILSTENSEISVRNADYFPIFLVKKPGDYHYESYALNHAPVVIQDQFFPTALMTLEMDNKEFGVSAFDLSETETIERWTRFYSKNRALYEYRYTGDLNALKEQILEGNYETFPIVDSFYQN